MMAILIIVILNISFKLQNYKYNIMASTHENTVIQTYTLHYVHVKMCNKIK